MLVVDRLLPQRLAKSLGHTAVYLPVDQQRIDHIAAIVHRDVPADLDLPGLAVNITHNDVCAERESKIRWLPEAGREQPRLHDLKDAALHNLTG